VDPLSQGALGAAVAACPSRGQPVAAAAGAGAVAGMAPDLDVFIRSSADPLLFLEYHRQFTHALAFVPLGALLCAVVLYPIVRRWLRPAALYGCCLLGYGSHGLLDACTSYGTQLLWPFSDARIAWNVVAVIDPLFTVPLLTLVLAAAWRGRPGLALAGACWALAYLALGAWQGERAERATLRLAEQRGHEIERLTVKPSFGNLLVWKSIYLADGGFHVDAARLVGAVTWYPGTRIDRLVVARDLPWLAPTSRQWRDLQRFRRFSADHLAVDPDDSTRVVDIRYSVVPNRVDALWGIHLAPGDDSDPPARFVQNSRASPAERAVLWAMLRGHTE
jgi:inner membrane protein